MEFKTLEDYMFDIERTRKKYDEVIAWSIKDITNHTVSKMEIALWIREGLTEEQKREFKISQSRGKNIL